VITVILHIGRHKTGTSSLQRFFYENSELLRQYGLVYPRIFIKNIAHHHLAEPFRKSYFNKLTLTEQGQQIASYRDKLRAALSDEKVNYIISSEAFQNVSPNVLREIFDPTVFNVRLVCYFREQITYLASAYNQRVHATNYDHSIYHYYRNLFRANYLQFADEFADCFDEYSFRIYDKDALIGKDLVADFLYRLVGTIPKNAHLSVDSNPSLGGRLLAVKRKVNRMVNKAKLEIDLTNRNIYLKLGELDTSLQGKKYKTPFLLSTIVFIKYRSSNQKFIEKYRLHGALNMKRNFSTSNIFYTNDKCSKEELLQVLQKLNK
jgi:hypothetical protein